MSEQVSAERDSAERDSAEQDGVEQHSVEQHSVEQDGVEQRSAEKDAQADGRLDLPNAGEWKRVSPKYLIVEIVGTIIFTVVVVAITCVMWLAWNQVWAAWVGGAIVLVCLVTLVLEPRRVRAIGYQLRADDLLFRRGIMFQRFVSVPYGRMQLVDITRGPVARWLGLADLKFVTAAASTAVAIPGLPEAEADGLRDRLVELAESRRAGL